MVEEGDEFGEVEGVGCYPRRTVKGGVSGFLVYFWEWCLYGMGWRSFDIRIYHKSKMRNEANEMN